MRWSCAFCAARQRRSPAMISIAVADRAEQDRLEHALVGDRLRELVERGFVEVLARLVGIGVDLRDVDLAHAAALRQLGLAALARRAHRFVEQRRQPAPEAGRLLHAAAAATGCGKRPIISLASRT